MWKNLIMERSSSVLLIHRYFWPDSPPYALILKELATLFTKRYQVEVLSAIPSYKKGDYKKNALRKEINSDGYKIKRIRVLNDSVLERLKYVNYWLFPFSVFIYILFTKKRDLITVSTAPAVSLAFMVALASKIRGSKLIYHCMDLHPEIGAISGDFSNRMIYWVMMKMDLFTCKTASEIVLLSSDMADTVTRRCTDLNKKITIINNFALSELDGFGVQPDTPIFKEDVTTFIFAGNLGRFQGLEELVDLFLSFEEADNIELIFIGDGALKKQLMARCEKTNNIRFLPHQPLSRVKAVLQQADYGVVSLIPGVVRCAFPSKTMTYLQCGLPIAFFTNEDSQLSRDINDRNIGFVLNEDSLKMIVKERGPDQKFLRSFLNDYYDQFSKKNFLKKFSEVLEKVSE